MFIICICLSDFFLFYFFCVFLVCFGKRTRSFEARLRDNRAKKGGDVVRKTVFL